MILGSLSKLDQGNTATPKKFDDDFMSENCDAIVIFPNQDQFGAIWKPDFGHTILTFSFILNFYLTETENRSENI